MPASFEVPLVLPRSLSLLAAALPLIPLAGRDIAQALTSERVVRRAIAPGIGLSLWIVLVQLVGRTSGSFVIGLWGAAAILATGMIAYRLLRRLPPRPPSVALTRGVGRMGWIFIILSAIPVAALAFGYAFHDEHMYAGHMAIASKILNGAYPPAHPTFPAFELRYHYGFDLLAACLSAILRIPLDTALDSLAVLLWVYTAYILITLGEIWFGRGVLMAMMMLFAGGPPVCFNGFPRKPEQLVGLCPHGNLWTVPPLLSSWFQHPWSLGLPLAFGALLLVTARERQRPPALRFAVLGLMLAALSLSESVMFVCTLPTLVAVEIWALRGRGPRAWLGVILAGGAALGLAFWMGGFFAPSPSHKAGDGFSLAAGMVDGLRPSLLWMAQSFGPAIVLGIVGVFLLPRRGRPATLLFLGGSLLVLCTIRYKHYPFDMVKFGVVSALAMGIGGACAVGGVLRGLRRWTVTRWFARLVLAPALVIAATTGGIGFLIYFVAYPKRVGYARDHRGMAREDIQAASYLRARMKPGELVFRREGPAGRYALWAGLSVPWIDWATYAFGFPEVLVKSRLALLKSLPPDPDPYLKQGIVWFVLEPDDKALLSSAGRWVATNAATQEASFGKLRIFHLTGARSR